MVVAIAPLIGKQEDDKEIGEQIARQFLIP